MRQTAYPRFSQGTYYPHMALSCRYKNNAPSTSCFFFVSTCLSSLSQNVFSGYAHGIRQRTSSCFIRITQSLPCIIGETMPCSISPWSILLNASLSSLFNGLHKSLTGLRVRTKGKMMLSCSRLSRRW